MDFLTALISWAKEFKGRLGLAAFGLLVLFALIIYLFGQGAFAIPDNVTGEQFIRVIYVVLGLPFIVIILLIILAFVEPPQRGGKYIHVTVYSKDSKGSKTRLPKARVYLIYDGTRKMITDDNGIAKFSYPPDWKTGNCVIEVEKDGYKPNTKDVYPANTQDVTIELEQEESEETQRQRQPTGPISWKPVFAVGAVLLLLFIGVYTILPLIFRVRTIKIVSSLPNTSLSKDQMLSIESAIQMALDEHGPSLKKFPNYKVEYHPKDDAWKNDEWDRTAEQTNANDAVADQDVVMYIGPFDSGAAEVSIPILNGADPPLPMISPSNTASRLTKPNFSPNYPDILYKINPDKRNYFRLAPTDDLQGKQAAQWARSIAYGLKNAYVLYKKGDVYSEGIAKSFEDNFKELGGHFVDYPINSMVKPSDLVDRVINSEAEVVYFGGTVASFAEFGLNEFLKELRERPSGREIKFMGPDGIQTQEFITRTVSTTLSLDIASGVLATMPGMPYEEYVNLNEEGGNFYNSFQSTYGKEPDPYAIFGYEAMSVTLKILDKVGPNRDAIRNELQDLPEDHHGALGTWRFDRNGDITDSGFTLYEVINGKFQYTKYKQVEAASTPTPPQCPSTPTPNRVEGPYTRTPTPTPPTHSTPATATALTQNYEAHKAMWGAEDRRTQTPIELRELGITKIECKTDGISQSKETSDLGNLQIQARFTNPLAKYWDYGVILHRDGNEYHFYVTSNGAWYLIVKDIDEKITVNSIEKRRSISSKTNAPTPTDNENELKPYIIGNKVRLFINLEWMGDFELPSQTPQSCIQPERDSILVATSFQHHNEQGQGLCDAIAIPNLRVWRLADYEQLTLLGP